MNPLTAPIEIRALQLAGEAVQTVDARDLHTFLQVGRDFSTWIRGRIKQYGFVEDVDFCAATVPGSGGFGGQNRLVFSISLDMAKELAMVERTERGKQARQYFIECERLARSRTTSPMAAVLNDPSELRRLLLSSVDRQIAMEASLAAQAPKVAALDRIAEANGAISITKAAKALQVRPIQFHRWLQEHGWLYRHPSGTSWAAYQQRIDRGQMVHKTVITERSDGTPRMTQQPLITSRGLARLAELLESEVSSDLHLLATLAPHQRTQQ